MAAPKLRLRERLAAIYFCLFPARHDHGFARHLFHHLPIIIGLSIVVALAADLGWFQGFQTMALDSLLLAQSSRRSDQVVVVTIDDDEFQSDELFNGTSPLKPEVIGEILSAIAAGKPRLIAVDLDTSSPVLADQYRQMAEVTTVKDGWPPVIWSCDGKPKVGHQSGHGVPILQITPALTDNRLAASGLINLPSDTDGVVRRYYRTFQTANGECGVPSPMDSLPWAVIKKYSELTPKTQLPEHLLTLRNERATAHEPNELLMNLPGDRYSFDHIASTTVLKSAKQAFWSGDKSPVHNKIVLLGGTYRAARDLYQTPVGRVPGIDLLAMTIESELQKTGIGITRHTVAILIDILFGALLVYLNWRFVSPRAMLWNLLAVGVLAIVASYITFNTFGYWLNFAVVLVGIWLHNQLDMFRELPSLRHEIDDLKHKLRDYERAEVSHSQESSASAAVPTSVTTGHLPEQVQ